jgi:hypothetical protein
MGSLIESLIALILSLPWKEIITLLLPLIILGVVQLIKPYAHKLKPYLPIIAPALGALASFLAGWLGSPVDFSPIIDVIVGAIAGSAAVGIHQISKQWSKRPMAMPSVEMRDGKVKRGL